MGSSQRQETKELIQREYRKNKNAIPDEIQYLLKKAESTMSYMRMITPKSKSGTASQSGRVTITYGPKTKSERKAVTNWHGKNLDPESVSHHFKNLKRAGFHDNNHAKGGFF
jgi:hypothetical protein